VRTGKKGRHRLVGLLRQSVFGRLAGYEDLDDSDRLCRDPAMRWVVGDRAITGSAASASQMGRFEIKWSRPADRKDRSAPSRRLLSRRVSSWFVRLCYKNWPFVSSGPYMGENGPAGMCIARTTSTSLGLIPSGRENAFRQAGRVAIFGTGNLGMRDNEEYLAMSSQQIMQFTTCGSVAFKYRAQLISGPLFPEGSML
jgi:hypothetical protein